MNFKKIKISYGIRILLASFMLLGVFFLSKGILGHLATNAKSEVVTSAKSEVLYAQLSDSSPHYVELHWPAVGYLFVGNTKDEEQLYAYGNGYKTLNDPWIHDGVKYEFNLYEDKEKKKPLASLTFIKSGNTIKQATVDLTQSSNASQISSDTTPVLGAIAGPNPTTTLNQSAHTKNHSHAKEK